uniref:Protein lin-41-like n=1 Tax=Crassostrea virginica TaxID=6565 RepID=A0A8B8BC03_CRAVI|nr:protein lin-41-like [Crassostrea virginica]
MWKDREAKVTRYNKAGKEVQNIQKDNQGQKLYSEPHYITENINGDICASNIDFYDGAVVVVNKSGHHRFSYTGQGSEFWPCGICTDVLGHILVCDDNSSSVHLLDQDGGFMSVILSKQQGIKRPRGVSVDNENNLGVGQWITNTVTVYKYLQ